MSSGTVEKIKERLSIADVVGSYLKLEKAGANMKAKCPFHNEKSASFFVSPSRNSYYCFGCGAKGDIFTFVEEFEGLDFMGALKVLAERAGVPLVPENPKVKSERERLYSVMEHAALFFQQNLGGHRDALLYLKKRGLKIETVRDWRIGFALLDWRTLLTHLTQKGFTEVEMEKAGLIKKADREDGDTSAPRLYDRFRGRVMFPIFDTSGRVIAFSGRILVDDGKAAKYLNSPETPLFNKSQVLYGYHVAKWEIKKKEFAILVEGQMDLLMSQQAGFGNTVAVSGTALTAEHLSLLSRLTKKVVLAFDADSAGFAAAEKSARVALSMGMEVRVAEIKGGKDPADLILATPDEWKKTVDGAVHVINFVFNKMLAEGHDSRSLGQEIRKKVLPYVVSLESTMERSHFVKEIAHSSGIGEVAIWEDSKRVEPIAANESAPARTPDSVFAKKPRRNIIETKLLGLLLWQEGIAKSALDLPALRTDFEKIVGHEKYLALTQIMTAEEKNQLIFEAETFFAGAEHLEKDVKDLFFNLKEDYLKESFANAMQELVVAERDKKTDRVGQLLQKCKDLGEELAKLRKEQT